MERLARVERRGRMGFKATIRPPLAVLVAMAPPDPPAVSAVQVAQGVVGETAVQMLELAQIRLVVVQWEPAEGAAAMVPLVAPASAARLAALDLRAWPRTRP